MISIHEREQGKIPGPAEQGLGELFLAKEIHRRVNGIIGKENCRCINFVQKGRLILNPGSEVDSMIREGERHYLAIYNDQMLVNNEWPYPGWTAMTASITKFGDELSLKIEGYKYPYKTDTGYGRHLILDGTYPRVYDIVPVDSQEAIRERKRERDGNLVFPEPIQSLAIEKETEISTIRNPQLRPRINRMKYWMFVLDRIEKVEASKSSVL